MGVIDCHAHAVLEAAFGAAGVHGPELRDDDGVDTFRVGTYEMSPMPYRGSVFMDVDKRLNAMDAAGIDRQLLSPNPLTFMHGIGVDDAVHYCRAHNDAMAGIVAAHPTRLLGAAALPMQGTAAAIAELERSVGDLGLVAAYVGTDPGAMLDDRRFDDLYRALVSVDVPLFVHPGSSDGVGPPADGRLAHHGLGLVLGYAYEETIAVASLVLGGVFDRHPDLDVCISHGGGVAIALAHRFEAMATFRRRPPGEFTDGLRHLWFDAHVGDHDTAGDAALDTLEAMVGHDRLVYGTNFGGWDAPAHTTERDASYTPNAERLLRLPSSGGTP